MPVIIGSGLAERLWRGTDAVGRRLQPIGDSLEYAADLVIAGVIAEGERGRADQAPEIFVVAGPDRAGSDLLVRTAGDAAPIVPELLRVAADRAPGWTPYASTVASLEAESLAIFRGVTRALFGAGILALLLSAIGLYAVMAFSVGQRSWESAVRMAVGAPAEKVAARFVGEGVWLGMFGLAIGLPISLAALHLLNAVLVEGVSEYLGVGLSEVTAVVVSVVVVTAVLATLVPAGRAAAVDPAGVLRRGLAR